METKEYDKVRRIRISDDVFEALKRSKPKGKTWNLYLKELLNKQK